MEPSTPPVILVASPDMSSRPFPEPNRGQRASHAPTQTLRTSGILAAGTASASDKHSPASLADDDASYCFSSRSRSPTQDDHGGSVSDTSASGMSEQNLDGKIASASTRANTAGRSLEVLDMPAGGAEKLSRSSSHIPRSRKDVKRAPRGCDIGHEISTVMNSRNGIGLDGMKQYISDVVLSTLMTDGNIRRTLRTESSALIQFTKENMKLLAVTVLVFGKPKDRSRAMDSFLRHGFSDGSLPVDDLNMSKICQAYCQAPGSSEQESDSEDTEAEDSQSDTTMECTHKAESRAFHGTPWTSAYFRTFYEKQWEFLLQDFRAGKIKHDLHDRIVLPFTEVKAANHVDEGHFSVVFMARMLACYQDAIETIHETIPVAIKELKQRTGPEYDAEGDWQREIDALTEFNKLGHNHIVRGIGAFKQKGRYYLIMEWADGGSLQQFWDSHPGPHPDLSASELMQFLKQLHGLADALREMHNDRPRQEEAGKVGEGGDEELKVSPIEINAPADDTGDGSWRHGDFKPGNILRFRDPSDWMGTLKIGDLGRAKQHKESTGRRRAPTNEPFFTERYEPPEASTQLLAPRSRLYDIWSLGCVILESIDWLLTGSSDLGTVVSDFGHGSRYWKFDLQRRNKKSATIRAAVTARLQQLLEEIPKQSALWDLTHLVKNKLLVVKVVSDANDVESDCRANSSTLCHELNIIISKANNDNSYLLKGIGRAGAPVPLLGQVVPEMDYLTPNRPIATATPVTRRTSLSLVGPPDSDSDKKKDSYVHDFDDTWKLENDNVFARKVLERADIDIETLLPVEVLHRCDKCKTFNFAAPRLKIKDNLGDLRLKAQDGCELCAMLLQVAEKNHSGEEVEFEKYASGLKMNRAPRGVPALSLRRTSGMHKLTSTEGKNNRYGEGPNYIQIGFPRIPEAGSPAHFGLLRAWLEDCDSKHPNCRQHQSTGAFPTRLIDVGSTETSALRLIESKFLTSSADTPLRYIALSHPWGDPKVHQRLCTTTANVENHKQKIGDKLPQTLADAVKIVRGLGVSYLWIDSLCIIQGDDGDFVQEAEHMETVYSSAYCVLAATSADGSSSGFLKRNSKREAYRLVEQDITSLSVQSQNGDLNSIYISEALDDFEKDVRESPLNQRGWVFQERALARRTIHFADKQTYWECGEGIRCETLTKMTNTYEMFLGDPNFPSYGLRHRKGGDIAFYEFLYEQYSNMSFSRPEDRPVAIGGLEQRLISALKTKGSSGLGNFGLFDEYWGRGLLWKRASDVRKMTRLTSGARGGNPAPSWSWMGHTGGITFMKHDPHTMEWLKSEITLPWSKLTGPRTSTTSYRGRLGLSGSARSFRIPSGQEAIGNLEIVYEDEDCLEGRDLKCLIIGRMNMGDRSIKQVRNYVLILAPKKSSGRDDAYERVGAGFLHGSLIDFDGASLPVSVV